MSGDVDEDPDPDSEFEGGGEEMIIGDEHHGKLFSHGNSLSGLAKGCATDDPADVENTIKFMAAGFSEESSTYQRQRQQTAALEEDSVTMQIQ